MGLLSVDLVYVDTGDLVHDDTINGDVQIEGDGQEHGTCLECRHCGNGAVLLTAGAVLAFLVEHRECRVGEWVQAGGRT